MEKLLTDDSETKRIDYLDSIRGIAAFAVYLGHYSMGFGFVEGIQDSLRSTPVSLLWNGAAGVSIFFVLSGFVLSYRYLGSSGSRAFSVLPFYLSRACRLYLPYWVVLSLSLVSWKWLFVHYQTLPPGDTIFFYTNWLGASGTLSPTRIVTEFAMIDLSRNFVMLPQAWTLSVELYLSLLLPLLLIMIRRGVWLFVSILIVTTGCSLAFSSGMGLSWFLLGAGLFHFMLGILLARFHDGLRSAAARWHWMIPASLIVVGGSLLNFDHFGNPELNLLSAFNPAMKYVSGVGAALLLLCFSIRPSFTKVLATPIFLYLGRISYSLYLCQFIILFIVTPRCLRWLNMNGFEADASRNIGLVVSTLAVLLLSDLLYRSIERPSIHLARRMRTVSAIPSA